MSLPVFTHSACLEHDTGAGHFERPQRLGAVIDALRTGVADDIDWREAPRATRGQLLRVPDASLLEAVLETRSAPPVELDRSEERPSGQACVRTVSTRGSADN